MTLQTYAVMEKDDLERFKSLGAYDVLLGTSLLNSDEGITMGFPMYAQKLAEAVKNKLGE